MKEIKLNMKEFQEILDFAKKYLEYGEENDLITITVDGSSGIGTTTKVALPAIIQGDKIMMVKTITDESVW